MPAKEYEPTPKDRSSVETMAAFGIPHVEIAKAIMVAPHTLRKYFREELDSAATKANAAVAKSLFLNATERNNVTAQIFWLKARAGWKDRDPTEGLVLNAGPVDLSVYSDDDLRTLKRILKPTIIDVEPSEHPAGRGGAIAKR